MIKLLRKNSSKLDFLSIQEFEKEMNLSWIPSLKFQTDVIYSKVVKRSEKAMKKKELDIREKWLGTYFQKKIQRGFMPNVSIRYIDQVLGYGVFAEEDMAPGIFIGEYTGLIRKRVGKLDRKNYYCFEYSIGDWRWNPFIIDAEKHGNHTRYINHSEDPNLEPISVNAGGVMHIILITLKPIKRGDQLCYHYGDTFWKKHHHKCKIIDL